MRRPQIRINRFSLRFLLFVGECKPIKQSIEMKKQNVKEAYEAPMNEVLGISVECGFAASTEDWKEEEVTPDWDEQ